jgi:capsular polysaccharide biosynthesis protein
MEVDPKLEIIATEAAKKEYIPSLKNLFQVIQKRFWIVLLVATGLAGAAVGLSLGQTPIYEASVKILVGQERGITADPSEVWAMQHLTQTMAETASSRPIAEEVIKQQNLRMTPDELLQSKLSVEQIKATQYIEVRYKDESPEKARQVANAIGDVLSKQVSEVSSSASGVTVTVWGRAAEPESPTSPNFVLNVGVGLAIGVLLGVGLAFLLDYLDYIWQSPEEVERISGVPTFGTIPEFRPLNGQQKNERRSNGADLPPRTPA